MFDKSSALKKPKPLVAQKEGMQLLSLQEQPESVVPVPQEMTKEALPRDTLKENQATPIRKDTIALLCAPPKPEPVEIRHSSKPRIKVRAIRTRSLVQTEI